MCDNMPIQFPVTVVHITVEESFTSSVCTQVSPLTASPLCSVALMVVSFEDNHLESGLFEGVGRLEEEHFEEISEIQP